MNQIAILETFKEAVDYAGGWGIGSIIIITIGIIGMEALLWFLIKSIKIHDVDCVALCLCGMIGVAIITIGGVGACYNATNPYTKLDIKHMSPIP